MMGLNIFFYAFFGSISLLIVFSTFYMIISEILGRISSNKKKNKSDEFIDFLIQGLINKTIVNYDDLVTLYRGINIVAINSEMERKIINYNLHRAFVKIINKKLSLKTEELNVIKMNISEFILINNRESPFSNLPDFERNIFKDIITFLESGNKEEIARKMVELNDIIIIRCEEQKKLIKLNKFSMPIAIISIIITILFGIISIIRGI
jgi:hypothetical protein